MAITNLLFDLDGTLTDPADGITRCQRYALESLHLPCPPREELLAYIGPPLREAFAALCGSSDPDLIERAVALYRERFAIVGMYENAVYRGVPEILRGDGDRQHERPPEAVTPPLASRQLDVIPHTQTLAAQEPMPQPPRSRCHSACRRSMSSIHVHEMCLAPS